MTEATDTMSSKPATVGQNDLSNTLREAKDAAGAQFEEAKQTARSALTDAQSAAADKGEEMKGVAADEIARTARGLEAAAAELDGSPLQQDLLREAAEGLKQISSAVQGKSIGTMVEDLSEFGRRNPLAYLGGAALAGFALARFARASAPEPKPSWQDRAPSGTPSPAPTGSWQDSAPSATPSNAPAGGFDNA